MTIQPCHPTVQVESWQNGVNGEFPSECFCLTARIEKKMLCFLFSSREQQEDVHIIALAVASYATASHATLCQ